MSPDPSSQGLTVATTARTTRFCRTQLTLLRLKGFARRWRRSSARRRTSRGSSRPGPAFACPTLPRPPHPGPRSLRRTIAPLPGPGWGMDTVIPNFGKVEYFWSGGLTGFRVRWVFCPTGQICMGDLQHSAAHQFEFRTLMVFAALSILRARQSCCVWWSPAESTDSSPCASASFNAACRNSP